MKLILNNIIFFWFIFCLPVQGENITKSYKITINGIKIGGLEWSFESKNNEYTNYLMLNNEGFLSAIYSFEGKYSAKGLIKGEKLTTKEYQHFWKTKKKIKTMSLYFDKEKLISYKQTPVENEKMRLDMFRLKNINDPVNCFLQILNGYNNLSVLDGRRSYVMVARPDKKEGWTSVNISDYINIWADHKKNKFEKIIFEKPKEGLLPSSMIVYFDGKIFTINED